MAFFATAWKGLGGSTPSLFSDPPRVSEGSGGGGEGKLPRETDFPLGIFAEEFQKVEGPIARKGKEFQPSRPGGVGTIISLVKISPIWRPKSDPVGGAFWKLGLDLSGVVESREEEAMKMPSSKTESSLFLPPAD